ncbi:MAG: NAD(P)H-dependent oxidoreductase subunit E [Pseudomonadota bacterium]
MYRANKLVQINSDLTPQLISRIDKILDAHKGKPGCLIPALEQCQDVVGYLPVELQEYIGSRLNIAGSTIYGVVTFYSFFTMVPKGRHVIKVCMGTACYVRGIGEVLNRIQSEYKIHVGGTSDDRRFSLEAVRCLGACGLAPVVVIDQDTHGNVTPDGILGILEKYH